MIKKLRENKWISTVFWSILLICIWEIAATQVAFTKRSSENIIPHLYQIIAAIFSKDKVNPSMTAIQLVLSSAGITIYRAIVGFIIGSAAGFALAIFMKLSGIIEKIVFPYLMIIQMIPILGMAPIILSITGDINVSRIVIAAILTFYPVATNTLAGLKSVEKEKYELMSSYAASKWNMYRKVLIPSSLPYFFTGLKISAPVAITASILVDTLQGDGGLGCVLSQSLRHAMSIYVFWIIVFFSAFIGVMSWKIIEWLEMLVNPHKRPVRKSGRKERMVCRRKEKEA